MLISEFFHLLRQKLLLHTSYYAHAITTIYHFCMTRFIHTRLSYQYIIDHTLLFLHRATFIQFWINNFDTNYSPPAFYRYLLPATPKRLYYLK